VIKVASKARLPTRRRDEMHGPYHVIACGRFPSLTSEGASFTTTLSSLEDTQLFKITHAHVEKLARPNMLSSAESIHLFVESSFSMQQDSSNSLPRSMHEQTS